MCVPASVGEGRVHHEERVSSVLTSQQPAMNLGEDTLDLYTDMVTFESATNDSNQEVDNYLALNI